MKFFTIVFLIPTTKCIPYPLETHHPAMKVVNKVLKYFLRVDKYFKFRPKLKNLENVVTLLKA